MEGHIACDRVYGSVGAIRQRPRTRKMAVRRARCFGMARERKITMCIMLISFILFAARLSSYPLKRIA